MTYTSFVCILGKYIFFKIFLCYDSKLKPKLEKL